MIKKKNMMIWSSYIPVCLYIYIQVWNRSKCWLCGVELVEVPTEPNALSLCWINNVRRLFINTFVLAWKKSGFWWLNWLLTFFKLNYHKSRSSLLSWTDFFLPFYPLLSRNPQVEMVATAIRNASLKLFFVVVGLFGLVLFVWFLSFETWHTHTYIHTHTPCVLYLLGFDPMLFRLKVCVPPCCSTFGTDSIAGLFRTWV